jgi:DNA-binding response OmpR family regulator
LAHSNKKHAHGRLRTKRNDLRVLIVDDDPLIRDLLQAYLSQEGYTVHCAATAEQAEALLAEQPVELVMLDIRLPGKDGLTLTRELRVRSEVGIILITGRNDDIDRIVGLECGADDYVSKPLNPASWCRGRRT